jgi:hypothetical protein
VARNNTVKKPSRSQNKAESDLPPGLAAPARRALDGAGITRLDQLARLSEAEVKALHGIGPNALAVLRRALAARGLSFRAVARRPAR